MTYAHGDVLAYTQCNRAHTDRQRSPVTLPNIGVRAHRIYLSKLGTRPTIHRLATVAPVMPVGPSVTPELDGAATGSWALVSFLFIVLLVSGCVAMVRR